jgi:hypothetical protein
MINPSRMEAGVIIVEEENYGVEMNYHSIQTPVFFANPIDLPRQTMSLFLHVPNLVSIFLPK